MKIKDYQCKCGNNDFFMSVAKQIKKYEKETGYKGCKNCVNQIEPLRMCEWAEHGGDGHLHLICPRWEKKDGSDNKGE